MFSEKLHFLLGLRHFKYGRTYSVYHEYLSVLEEENFVLPMKEKELNRDVFEHEVILRGSNIGTIMCNPQFLFSTLISQNLNVIVEGAKGLHCCSK